VHLAFCGRDSPPGAPEAHNFNQGAPQLPKARLYAAGAPGNARCALGIVSAPQRHRCTCRSADAPDSRARSSGRYRGQAGHDARVPHPRSAPARLARCAAWDPEEMDQSPKSGGLPLFKALSPQSSKWKLDPPTGGSPGPCNPIEVSCSKVLINEGRRQARHASYGIANLHPCFII
jgi:hypothetical protein